MTTFYATTPIYYVNDAPHVGHAYNALATDAVSRWHRLLGEDVLMLTGTDEHGLKVQRAAEQAGTDPKSHADVYSARFRDAWDSLDIAYDDFIRTTEARHSAAVTALLTAAYENGYIYQGTYEGLYCVSCEAYYTDDEVLDSDDGVGLCPVHRRPVERMVEDNYFFKLSAFEDKLMAWHDAVPDNITPEGFRNEAIGLVKQGLDDVSISRSSISWGVPVPWDESHVFYVWFDALINYASAIGYGTDPERFARWWPAEHFIGKDILRFHGVYWPAMLMAAGIDGIDEMPRLRVHGYLLLGGEKMAKSGNVTAVTPAEMVELFGVDGFRYSLLRDSPYGPDSDFSYESLLVRYNTDLANNYGNLVQRLITVATKKCGGVAPAPDPDSPLRTVVAGCYNAAVEAWAKVQPSVALEAASRIVRETNEMLQATEPWKLEPGPDVDAVMGNGFEALRIATLLLTPVIPGSAAEAWERMGLVGVPQDERLPEAATWGSAPADRRLENRDPLFPRIKG